MAAPGSRRLRKRPEATAAAQVDAALAGFFQARLTPGARVCVGLSGGIDSVVLLHALWRMAPAIRLSAAHVHHGISTRADVFWIVTFGSKTESHSSCCACEHREMGPKYPP